MNRQELSKSLGLKFKANLTKKQNRYFDCTKNENDRKLSYSIFKKNTTQDSFAGYKSHFKTSDRLENTGKFSQISFEGSKLIILNTDFHLGRIFEKTKKKRQSSNPFDSRSRIFKFKPIVSEDLHDKKVSKHIQDRKDSNLIIKQKSPVKQQKSPIKNISIDKKSLEKKKQSQSLVQQKPNKQLNLQVSKQQQKHLNITKLTIAELYDPFEALFVTLSQQQKQNEKENQNQKGFQMTTQAKNFHNQQNEKIKSSDLIKGLLRSSYYAYSGRNQNLINQSVLQQFQKDKNQFQIVEIPSEPQTSLFPEFVVSSQNLISSRKNTYKAFQNNEVIQMINLILTIKPQIIKNLFQPTIHRHYICWLFTNSRFLPIKSDGRFPFDCHFYPLFGHIDQYIWPSVLFKSLAFVTKSYQNISKLSFENIFSMLTGLRLQSLNISDMEKNYGSSHKFRKFLHQTRTQQSQIILFDGKSFFLMQKIQLKRIKTFSVSKSLEKINPKINNCLDQGIKSILKINKENLTNLDEFLRRQKKHLQKEISFSSTIILKSHFETKKIKFQQFWKSSYQVFRMPLPVNQFNFHTLLQRTSYFQIYNQSFNEVFIWMNPQKDYLKKIQKIKISLKNERQQILNFFESNQKIEKSFEINHGYYYLSIQISLKIPDEAQKLQEHFDTNKKVSLCLTGLKKFQIKLQKKEV